MIRINKTGHPIPACLTNAGVTARNAFIVSYTANSASYEAQATDPVSTFGFDNKIYGHDDVKTSLKGIQGHKCCFCEAKVSHVSHGDVEHFRPKGRYKQDEDSDMIYPGYFWLAYDWSNLYFSCQICNQRHKKNFFPLIDNNSRALPTVRDITGEEPSFIDPGILDPEDHIYFISEVPTHKSDKGKTTIEELGINRQELNSHRYDKLDGVRALETVMKLAEDSAKVASIRTAFLDRLRKCVQPTSEYSSMFKSNFSAYLSEL